jgi:hypothetical protein
MNREFPRSRNGVRYRRLLGVLGVAAIVGIAFAVSSIVGTLLDGPIRPGGVAWKAVASNALVLLGWVWIGILGYRAVRRNLAPPTWAILFGVGVGWAALLVDHVG